MKTIKRITWTALISFGLIIPGSCLAQTEPPPLPPLPEGEILDIWFFQTTNYMSVFGEVPLSFTNPSLTPDWDGNGLMVDSEDPAILNYPVLRNDEWPAISFTNGTIAFWFSSDWNSADELGNWGTLIEAGAWNTNSGTAWGLYISPDGSNICFSAENGTAMTNYLTAPISWNAGDFHSIVLTYSATNSALYLEGQLAASGSGVTPPDSSVLTNGFSVGSDGNATGMLQARGIFNDLATYNYDLAATTISNDYYFESQNVYLLPGGFSSDFSGPPPIPGGGGGTNTPEGGGGGSGYTPTVYTNGFSLQILSPGSNLKLLCACARKTGNTRNIVASQSFNPQQKPQHTRNIPATSRIRSPSFQP